MNNIDTTKLKRNTNIIVETKDTVFEIKVTVPKSSSIIVSGGLRFIKPTKAKIQGLIKKGSPILFLYNKNVNFKSSIVLSATIYASDNSWHYDVIEKDKNEDTN